MSNRLALLRLGFYVAVAAASLVTAAHAAGVSI